MSKIWRDLRQFSTLSSNISEKDGHIDKRQTALSTTVPTALNKKIGEFWSTNDNG